MTTISDFDLIESKLRADGVAPAFDFLIQKFQSEGNYGQLFQTRLLRKRLELGIPLVQREFFEGLLPEQKKAYEESFIQAAREAGELFLESGDLPRAWSYYRVIGETQPIVAALDGIEEHDNMAAIIEIAFQEQVHPRKGFELILKHYGICRAISSVYQYPNREGREECVKLLVRTLYADLAANLKRTIAQQEPDFPDSNQISHLLQGRDWLFENNCYYIDTSHVSSVVQYSLELSEPEILAMVLHLADYGSRLGPMFQNIGNPPFEQFRDYVFYFKALLGQEVDQCVEHFRTKMLQSDPDEVGTVPAQVLVALLARLERFDEAIAISLERLKNADPNQLACPTLHQLCQWGKQFHTLREVSKEQGDLINFTAALLQEESR